MAESRYIVMNGTPVPFAEARIHVLSPALTYAATVFEGIRAYWNHDARELFVFRLDDHLRRLQFSMRALRFGAVFDLATLREHVLLAVRANELREDIHLRVMAMIEGYPAITTSAPVTLAVTAGPFPKNKWQDKGMTVGVSTWQRIHDSAGPPRVKTTANYSNGRHAMLEALGDGYDAALMLTREGHVAEAPVANFIMIRDGRVATPRGTDGILEGVTRATLMQLFKDHLGLVVEERAIDRSEVYSADEALFCGSGWEIVPIASLDRIALSHPAPGPMTQRIREHYFDVVTGRNPGYEGWRTAVWR